MTRHNGVSFTFSSYTDKRLRELSEHFTEEDVRLLRPEFKDITDATITNMKQDSSTTTLFIFKSLKLFNIKDHVMLRRFVDQKSKIWTFFLVN